MNPYCLAFALACCALLAVGFVRLRMPVIGLYVVPIAILAVLFGASWLATHLTFELLSYALFVLLAAAILVCLVYERRIKAKRFSDDSRPSGGRC